VGTRGIAARAIALVDEPDSVRQKAVIDTENEAVQP
jgi:hypothetical protein